MYHLLLTKQEIEYIQTLINKKLDNYLGHDSKLLERIQMKLDDPETADNYYDGPEY